jgi:pimeloyl-ACP methyl ester carboxylesterase
VALAMLTACAHRELKPDLRRLYQSANLAAEQPPLIVIPGIMGSKLRDKATGQVVWPGSLVNLLTNKFDALALAIDTQTLHGSPGNLEAFDVTDTAAGIDFYERIVQTLVRHGDFIRTAAGTRVTDAYERHLYVFPYDWRLDNVETAGKLAALIEQIRADYGRPDLKVDIVAHSMGGIVSRYFMRYGTADALDRDDVVPTMAGADRINRLILLGTPSLGSASTIRALIEGEKVVRTIAPETLATLPSIYQLLPNSARKPLLGIDGRPLRVSFEDGASAERDVFDIGTWRELQWAVFDPAIIARVRQDTTAAGGEGAARVEVLQRYFARYLQRAGRLQKALSAPQPESHVKLIVFGADCTLTPARVLVENEGGRWLPRYLASEIKNPQSGRPYDMLLVEPGDGRVGKPSLLGRQSLDPTVNSTTRGGFPIAYSFFLCEAHDQIPGNINFQDNLLNALLSRDAG